MGRGTLLRPDTSLKIKEAMKKKWSHEVFDRKWYFTTQHKPESNGSDKKVVDARST